jgi:hypothetical protein
VPRDCLVMIGHSARRSSPLATRVALRDVGDGPGGVDLPRHLELLERAGCDGAFAIVLAGDGFETVEQSRTDDARRVALEVVRAAALRGPGGFDVPEAWVVSDGWADSLALTPEDDGTFALRLHQQQEPLTAPRDTLVGVQEIHAGRMVPEEDHALERNCGRSEMRSGTWRPGRKGRRSGAACSRSPRAGTHFPVRWAVHAPQHELPVPMRTPARLHREAGCRKTRRIGDPGGPPRS